MPKYSYTLQQYAEVILLILPPVNKKREHKITNVWDRKFLSVYQCNIILFNKYSVHKLRTLIPPVQWVLLTGESQHIDWVTNRFLAILGPFVSHWPMPKFNASIVWSEIKSLLKTRSLLWNIWWWYSQWAWSLKWPVCGWLRCFF